MKRAAISITAYMACIVGANWALATFGIVPIGFGIMAPAGVYFAGLSFTARDLAREATSRKVIAVAIVGGALLSAFIENGQRIALASGIAFLVSEAADALVYEPLRERRWLTAVALSNTVGLVLDSALFLWIAFGSLNFIEGQVVGKAYMTALAVVVLWCWKNRSPLLCVFGIHSSMDSYTCDVCGTVMM